MAKAETRASGSSGAAKAGRSIRIFDFRRPSKFSRDDVRTLQAMLEGFTREFGTVVASTIRTSTQMTAMNVEELSYEQYLQSVDDSGIITLIDLDPLKTAAVLHVPWSIAIIVLDRLLGGPGTGGYPPRALTDIEVSVLRDLLARGVEELKTAFESLVPIRPRIVGIGGDTQFTQIAAASDMVVQFPFEMGIGEISDRASLCIPAAPLQPALESFAGHKVFGAERPEDPLAVRHALDKSLNGIEIEVAARFNPVLLTSADVVGLRAGDILPLHHRAERPLTLFVDDAPCFEVRPGKKGSRLACMVVRSALDAGGDL